MVGRVGVLSAPGASSSGGAARATATAKEQQPQNEHSDAPDRDESDEALGVNEQFGEADGFCGLHFVVGNG